MADPYLSEIKYLGAGSQDFVEVVLDEGEDPSGITVVIYRSSGAIRSSNALGSPAATEYGKDIYVLDEATTPTFTGLHKSNAVALVKDGTVLSFVSFTDDTGGVTATEGPAAGMTSTEIGAAGSGESLVSTDGATYGVNTSPDPGSVPCFMEGTRIMTPNGPRAVEDLMPGDRVVTRDNGIQTLRWAGRCEVNGADRSLRALMPVRIRAGAIAPGVPMTDLYLSPNHRVLVAGQACNLYFGRGEVLSAIKHLQDGRGVTPAPLRRRFTYHHLLFDQHEVVFSNGMATESFHPGHSVLEGFGEAARTEVFALFPELRLFEGAYGRLARMDLTGAEASVLRALN